MCEYCGCQHVPAIAELTAEHDRLRELSRDLGRAADSGDFSAASDAATAMRAVLGPHTTVEEQGLFPLLTAEFPDAMTALNQEHQAVETTLVALADSAVPPPDWQHLAGDVVAVLFEHILREQDGVFPAVFAILTPDGGAALEAIRLRVGSPVLNHQ